jgi:hypothetical protein
LGGRVPDDLRVPRRGAITISAQIEILQKGSERGVTEKQFVFGVDLDGTVADYYAGLRPIAAGWLGAVGKAARRSVVGVTRMRDHRSPRGGYEGRTPTDGIAR